jgi:uncharacterized membrane protein YhiD involved in acid resistance
MENKESMARFALKTVLFSVIFLIIFFFIFSPLRQWVFDKKANDSQAQQDARYKSQAERGEEIQDTYQRQLLRSEKLLEKQEEITTRWLAVIEKMEQVGKK